MASPYRWEYPCGPTRLLLGVGLRAQLAHALHTLPGQALSPRCVVIVDEAIAPLWQAQAAAWLPAWETFTWVLPSGEAQKNLANWGRAAAYVSQVNLTATDSILAVGGGRVGDFAGWLAAAYWRGMAWINLPTTLLAAHDSCLGGKVAVNGPTVKNQWGAFHPPRLVLIDPAWLTTLPAALFRAGYAEAVKHALLTEKPFLDTLWDQRQTLLDPHQPVVLEAIRQSLLIKWQHVEGDPQETRGQRVLLHLGHTFAHALESLSHYTYSHGEAVALGLCVALALSERHLSLVPTLTYRVRRLLSALGLPTQLRQPLPLAPLLQALRQDRKRRGAGYTFVLLSALGKARLQHHIPEAVVKAAVMAVNPPPEKEFAGR